MSDEVAAGSAASDDRQEVTAAAIMQNGTILLAQRTYPPDLAGQWELPGGKVHEGELPAEALRRELEEELGVTSAIGPRIGADVLIAPAGTGNGYVLRAYLVQLIEGDPEPREHADVRWFTAAELREADLVPNDRVWIDDLCEALAEH